MAVKDVLDSLKSAGLFKPGAKYDYSKDPDFQNYLRERQRQEGDVINKGLDAGLSWEQIAGDSGIPIDRVKSFSQSTRPDYGTKVSAVDRVQKFGANLSTTPGQAAGEASLNDAQQKILGMLNDPNLPPERRAVLLTAINEQGLTEPKQAAADTANAPSGSKLAKQAAETVAKPFIALGDRATEQFKYLSGPGRGINTDQLQQAQQKAQSLPDNLKAKATQIRAADQLQVLKMVQEGKSNDEINKYLDQAVKSKAEDDKRMFGEAASIASYGIGGSGAVQSALKGTIGDVLLTAGGGALGAGGGQLAEDPNSSASQILKSATVGGLTAGALGATSVLLGSALRKFKSGAPLNAAEKQAIADSKNLTPEVKAAALETASEPKLTSAPLTQEAGPTSTMPGATTGAGLETSGSALKTEASAVQRGIAQELPNKAQYQTANFGKEAEDALTLVRTDRQAAEDIAFGNVRGRSDVQEVAVRKAIEQEALRNQDATTLARLAESQSNVETSKAAQRLGAESFFRDRYSPVGDMADIIKARKASNVEGIPKNLSPEEQANITKMWSEADKFKRAWQANGGSIDDPARFVYGAAQVKYDNYVEGLKLAAKDGRYYGLTVPQKAGQAVTDTGGFSKAVRAAFDMSRLLRQDWKTLFSHPSIWAKNAAKSFKDAGLSLKHDDILDAVKADIISRPNVDLYQAMEKATGTKLFPINEEAFPTSAPEKLPGVGRLYRASEVGFTAGQWRQRADLTDLYANIFKNSYGKDLTDKKFLADFGEFIGDLTSRGQIKNQGRADTLNKLFFAPRNLKANVRFLTSELGRNADPAIKMEAAKNLLKTVAGTTAILTTAAALRPGSVERDPRSSNFGKIKVGNTRFDMTGGMASLLTLATRTLPTIHNGQVGLWKKSSTNGQYTNLWDKKYGASTGFDNLMDFAQGKAAPAASVVIDYLKGETFTGDKVTPKSELANLFVPLPVTNYLELKNDPKSANKLVALIADGLGISTNTYSGQKDWNKVDTKQIQGFKKTVSPQIFNQANQQYNDELTKWSEMMSKNPTFQKLSEDSKTTLLNDHKRQLTEDILKRYNYTYKRQTNPENDTIKSLKQIK